MKKKKKSPAQEYLEKIRKLDVQIDCMLAEKEQLEDMALRITPSMSGAGGATGGNQDKLGGAVARIVDKENEIDQTVDALITIKQEASSLLACMDDTSYMKVLHERYIQYKSFESIAAQMGYTYRGICYLHGRALQAFGKVLEAKRRTDEDFRRMIMAAHNER